MVSPVGNSVGNPVASKIDVPTTPKAAPAQAISKEPPVDLKALSAKV